MILSEVTLLRERFTISSVSASDNDAHDTHAASNRIALEIFNRYDETTRTYVVRSKNMHGCVRMAVRILTAHDADHNNMLMNKTHWKAAWDGVNNDFEAIVNSDNWCAVYLDGAPIFKSGTLPPFLDVIEDHAAQDIDSYDEGVLRAQDILRAQHPDCTVRYLSTVALNVQFEDNQTRCYALLRGVDGSRTFSFAVREYSDDKKPENPKPLDGAQCLMASAAFLEGVQLAFTLTLMDQKPKLSKKDQTLRAQSLERLVYLQTEIKALETQYKVNYRPEKPDFFDLLVQEPDIGQD